MNNSSIINARLSKKIQTLQKPLKERPKALEYHCHKGAEVLLQHGSPMNVTSIDLARQKAKQLMATMIVKADV